MSVILRIFKEIGSQKRELLLLLFLVTVTTGLDIVIPFIAQTVIDKVIDTISTGFQGIVAFLLYAGAAIVGITIFHKILQFFFQFRFFIFVTRYEDALRHEAFYNYLKLHALFHHNSDSGQMMSRIERGGSAIYEILHDVCSNFLLRPFIMFVVIFAVLLYKSPLIALIIFLPLPVYIFLTIKLGDRMCALEKDTNDAFEQVSKEEYDIASNILTVKNFSKERKEAKKRDGLQMRARKAQYETEKYWYIIEFIQTCIANLGRAAVIVVSGYFASQKMITIGELVLFVSLQGMVYEPLAYLSVFFPKLRRALVRAERLFTLIDEPIHVTDKKDAVILPELSRDIRFENVCFGYNTSRMVLCDIQITIPAHKMTALVGRSGSGKSTFIKLLLRSYDVNEGRILFDSVDIRDVTQESLRSQIAVVSQEVDLFSRTIRENIAYGAKGEVSEQDIHNAAKLALAHDFIIKTKKGYDSHVGEKGIKLSGGEKQRIGIARAALCKPALLILDEATSHLDTESEKMVQQALDRLIQGRTIVAIAHRLSTILHADQIIVFHEGRIEAVGTHTELLQKCELYKKLYELQFAV